MSMIKTLFPVVWTVTTFLVIIGGVVGISTSTSTSKINKITNARHHQLQQHQQHYVERQQDRRSLQVGDDYESFTTCDEAFGTRLTHGIWTSRGFGFAIQVNNDQTCTIFQETDVSCIQDAYFFDWYILGNFTYPDGTNGDVVSIDWDQQIDVIWDRTEEFQRNCSSGETPSIGRNNITVDPYEPDALRTFDFFYQTFIELYFAFDVRGVDWDQVTADARAGLNPNSTTEEVFDALCSCIEPLQDYHAIVRAGDLSCESKGLPIFQQLFIEWTQQDEIESAEVYLVSQAVAWATSLASYMDPNSVGGTPIEPGYFYGTIDDGDIAYLQLNSVGFGDEQELFFALIDDLMMDLFSNATTLILDLRINVGGNDRTGLRLASYFVEETTESFFQRTMDYPSGLGAWLPNETVFMNPNPDGVQFQGDNVILITSDSCGSACETLTLAMEQTPKFLTSLGRNTIGALSYNTQRRLDNDFLVYTSNMEYFTPQGNSYEGLGIPPKIITETDLLPLEERQQGIDSWLEQAIEIAREETPATLDPSTSSPSFSSKPPTAAPTVEPPTESPSSSSSQIGMVPTYYISLVLMVVASISTI